jgi:trigger factor
MAFGCLLHKGKSAAQSNSEGNMTLKVTTEPRDERQLEVKIEVPQERVDQELRKAAAKVSSQYRLPGFRKGKAPYHIVVQQFGLANLYGEFVDKLGEQVYQEALKQENLEPYAMASLEDISLDPLVYTLVIPLEPTVDLGNYREIRVEKPATEVEASAVDAEIESYRSEHASWQSVEGPSAFGDMLTIDVKSVIAPESEGDEPVIVLDETDWDVTPDEENPMDPPGFDAALVGMQKGETKEFVLSWPAESQSIHAGKEATFSVTLKEIQRYESPALDDAFAALIDEETQTLDELRAKITERLQVERSADAENAFLTEALDALVKNAQLDYPPAVIEDQLDNMLRDYEMQLRQVGIESLAGFFEQTGQKIETFRESLRDQAVVSAERNLVLSEIIRAEQLEVSDEEIEARIAEMTKIPEDAEEDVIAQTESMKGLLTSGTGRSLIVNDIIREKALERVKAIAAGEELPERAEVPAPAEAESTQSAQSTESTESTESGAIAEVDAVEETSETAEAAAPADPAE